MRIKAALHSNAVAPLRGDPRPVRAVRGRAAPQGRDRGGPGVPAALHAGSGLGYRLESRARPPASRRPSSTPASRINAGRSDGTGRSGPRRPESGASSCSATRSVMAVQVPLERHADARSWSGCLEREARSRRRRIG
ncbi:MAG: hypothetical protein MZU84_03935 [Sphingobacterium sp.]|nr:hypothetical protein [Sphingobacterium sp.]